MSPAGVPVELFVDLPGTLVSFLEALIPVPVRVAHSYSHSIARRAGKESVFVARQIRFAHNKTVKKFCGGLSYPSLYLVLFCPKGSKFHPSRESVSDQIGQ